MRHVWQFVAIERAGNPRVAAICELCGVARVSGLPATGSESQLDLTGECPARENERAMGIGDVFSPGKR